MSVWRLGLRHDFHACNINPIQPGLQGGGYKVPALTLSVHKFLNIKQTLQKLQTFPKMYLRTIIVHLTWCFLGEKILLALFFELCIFFLPFVKKCIVVAFHWDFFVHFDYFWVNLNGFLRFWPWNQEMHNGELKVMAGKNQLRNCHVTWPYSPIFFFWALKETV